MSEFGDFVPRGSLGPINVGLQSASEDTMRSLLGQPTGALTADQCSNDLASDTVLRLRETRDFGLFRVTGIKPALDSLATIFAAVKAQNPGLFAAIGTAGMLCVRLRRPTSGVPSTAISNHAWGTAIDITIDGVADTVRDDQVQKGIALLIPFFNSEGWYSGVGFKDAEDDTHFEVGEAKIQSWAAQGLFDPPEVAAEPIITANLPRRAFDFFVNTGWTQEQAAGLIANIDAESGFDAQAVGDGGNAFGLCQWQPPRQANFANEFGHSIGSAGFDEQLAFVNFELREGGETAAGQALGAVTTAGEEGARQAAVVVCTRYERPADAPAKAVTRGDKAVEFYRALASVA